ncbi:MAG: DUF4263 domain-containing protein [Alphaproteobacteria bacterium]|nr:DUF4263 domain-containing protein [Alphaproteobacteria bacterium]
MIKIRSQYERAISELKSLLSEDSNNEDKYQKWFEEHPVALKSMNYIQSISQPKLTDFDGKNYFPDFIVKKLSGIWEIFELKLPYERILKNKERRNTFYSKVYEYLEQCTEYSEFFNDNKNRKNFSSDYNIYIPSAIDYKLVIGRDLGLDRYELERILGRLSKKASILTYDDVLRQLEFDKLKALGEYEGLPGITIHIVANIKNTQNSNYILSLGKDDETNNISIYINSKGDLRYKLVDKHRMFSENSVNKEISGFEFGETSYFIFEFGFSDNYTICSTEINGKYGSVVRLGEFDFDSNDLMRNMVLGSDHTGQLESDFDLYSFIVWEHTQTIDDRVNIRKKITNSILSKKEVPNAYLTFFDGRFLYKNGNVNFEERNDYDCKNLIQPENEKQPGLISKGIKRGQLFVPALNNQVK